MISAEQIRDMETTLLNSLRAQEGLPAKRHKTRFVHDAEVLSTPDRATVTGTKEERGFTYLNLNGGDSFGYYHPTEKPEVIFNFKGEPNYATRDLDPDYYTHAKKRAKKVKAEEKELIKQAYIQEQNEYFDQTTRDGGCIYLTFRDRITDQYYAGFHDADNLRNEFNPVASKDRANDYLAQQRQPKPVLIETWNHTFDPNNPAVFDPSARFINQFEPSEYMKKARKLKRPKKPRTIMRVISHALGDDARLIEHFLNWISVVFQYRIRTQTAWVLQGTTGTGKGLLFSEIIRPLIGQNYCRSITLPNLEDQFNKFLEQCLVVFIDEVDTDQVRDMPKLMARLKNMITEPKIPLRAMRADLREGSNYLNLIMASNQPNSMRIEENDRRFNVCLRQEKQLLGPLDDGKALIEKIREELPAFATYLASRKADLDLARQAVDNPAKQALQSITQTAIEEVAEALRDGDLAYFIDHIPSEPHEMLRRVSFSGDQTHLVDEYRRVISDAIASCESKKSHLLVHRNLYALFELLVGQMPNTKTKLTKRLGHVRIPIKPKSDGGTSKRGFPVKWQAEKKDLVRWKQQLEPTPLKAAK